MNLSGNDIDEDGIKVLANGFLKNESLINLGLSHNVLGDEGVITLCHSIKNHPNLKYMDISHCEITCEGIVVLSEELIGKLHDIEELADGTVLINGVSILNG